MFSYYGSKSKIVNLYPAPRYGKIIEPFAGSARYSLKYWDRDILLVDKYEIIVKVWKWLQQCSPQDVLGLPEIEYGKSVDDYHFDCQEAKWLVGFNIATAPQQPKKSATYWKSILRPNTQNYKRQFIAYNLYKIRHWKIVHGDYHDICNEEATWFVDPPYQIGGQYYKYNEMNYNDLSLWCKSRQGQIIVCENMNATWLDFTPIKTVTGNNNKQSIEAMWTNYVVQQQLM